MYEDNERLIREYQEGRKELLGVIVENNLGLIHTALKSFKWAYNNHPMLMTFYTVQKLTVFTVHKLLVEMASLIGLPFV